MFSSTRERLAWVAMTLGLGIQLRFDPLRVVAPGYKGRFQFDSDLLVYYAMADRNRGLLDPLRCGLRNRSVCAPLLPNGADYTSQFGLQGIVMAAVSPGSTLYGAMRVVTAILLAAVVSTAVVACWRAWGGRAAAVLLAFMGLSTWLNAFGPSTYWQLWTMLLPTLVPLLAWPRMGAGRRKWVRGGALIAALVFLKCLCGYEYVTCVVFGAVAAVAFHEFRDRLDRRFLLRLAAAGAAGVVGFGAAMAVHVVQLLALFGTTSPIWSRAGERMYAPSTYARALNHARGEHDPVLGTLLQHGHALGLWTYRFLRYLRSAAISMPSPPGLGLGPVPYRIPIYVFVSVFFLLAWQAYRGRIEEVVVMRRLAVAGGISLVGAMSWLLLAFGHMINHPHLDAIVFYLPFLPVVFAMIAVRAESISRRVWPRRDVDASDASATSTVPEADATRILLPVGAAS